MRWTCHLTKNREKPNRWLQAPYQKCTAKLLWTSLPSFSKSTQREHSIIIVEKGISVDQPKTLLPLSNHCFSQTSELDKRRCRPRERIQILLWFIQLSLLSKLWVRCFCLGYSNILFLWWPFPDIPNEGDWWVRDRLLPSFSKKGSTWLQIILLAYGFFLTESEWRVGSIHSMKMTGFSFYHSPDILE